MNRLGAALTLAFTTVAIAFGCSTAVHDPDSETHWLHCSNDADCSAAGSGLSCIAGACKPGSPRKDLDAGALGDGFDSGAPRKNSDASPPISSGDGNSCPFGCPAPFVVLTVTTDQDGGGLNGITVTLSGPTPEIMTCRTYDSRTASCFSSTGFATEGNYSLEVTAPGFKPLTVSATVTVAFSCGCTWASLSPSEVTLQPDPWTLPPTH